MVVGALLLGAELVGVDAAFYLVFIGAAAILTGLVGLFGINLPDWAQWLLFAALAIATMVLFRERLYLKMRGVATDYKEGLDGDELVLSESLEPGASCRMDYRGTTWTVLNGSDASLAAGTEVRVQDVEGLTLVVEPR
jgi:membrane protein implicated in regulation of membrane protease activity